MPDNAMLAVAAVRLEIAPLKHLVPVLAGTLRDLIEDGQHFLVLEVDNDRGYYAQFAPSEAASLYCEVASNEFLAPEHRLDEVAQGLLIGLGWSSPGPNHGMHWPAPVPVDLVAMRVADTLRQVYGVSDSAHFQATLGTRSQHADTMAGFVIEGFWPATTSPVEAFGIDGPEQAVFKVRGRSRTSVSQLLALVPEDRLPMARRVWDEGGSEPLAAVAHDLSWALPLAADAESLPMVAIGRLIADLGELLRVSPT